MINMTEIVQEKSNLSITVIALSILAIIVLIVLSVIWINSDGNREVQKPDQPIPNHNMDVQIKDLENNNIHSNYIIYNEFNGIEKKGIKEPNALTFFDKATENSTFILEAWDDDNVGVDYYKKSGSCKVGTSDVKCLINLEKEGKPILTSMQVNKTFTKLLIYNQDGLIKKPIICFSHSTNIGSIRVNNYMNSEKPDDLKFTYDFCIVQEDIKEELVVFDLKTMGKGKVDLLLRDNCDGYSNGTCGVDDTQFSFEIQ